MAINVICPGCHTRFTVPDKYAGKQPPCPKCKTLINVPKLDEQVKVHETANEPGTKDKTGRPLLKPVARADAKFNPILAAAVGMITLGAFFGAFLQRGAVKDDAEAAAQATSKKDTGAELTSEPVERERLIARERHAPFLPTLIGLAVLSPLLVWAGYQFLRDAEKEPYRGVSLWLRVLVCAAAYAGLWGVYSLLYLPWFGPFALPEDPPQLWAWLYLSLPFIGAGSVAAWASLELEWGDAFMHYCFYLIVTVLLRVAMGVGAV